MNEEAKFLLVKRGLYYAPNNNGYTGIKAHAGRYREVDALGLDGVTAIHEDDAAMFSKACWDDVKVGYLLSEIAKRDAVIRDLLPGKLCGESWNLPDDEKVQITVTFGALRRARAQIEGQEA